MEAVLLIYDVECNLEVVSITTLYLLPLVQLNGIIMHAV